MLMIAEVVVIFNAKFIDQQIEMLINKIVDKYWYLRMEEIQYVFSMAEQGIYGPAYMGLKIVDILSWLHTYDTGDRQEHIDMSNGSNDKGSIFKQIEAKDKLKYQGEEKKQVMRFSAIDSARRKVEAKTKKS